MTTKDSLDLGPLPTKPRSHELEALSLQAFKNILSPDMFNIRDVRFEDYGVDVHIEVVHKGHPTNFLAHIQLKSTDHPTINADNSATVQVSSANLNYLLNSALGLYVLYIAPTNELRYVWTSSEYKRIEKASPGWRSNGTVSLRFARILDASAIEEIHERIIEKSVLHRQFTDVLAHKEMRLADGKADVSRVTIDTQNFTITDATIAFERLTDEGINLVAHGQAQIVLELAQHVDHATLSEKSAQVVLAYAHYSLGHFIQCEANLANAQLGPGSLDAHRQYLLVTLQNACEFHLGDMTRRDFLKSEKEALSHISDPALKLQAEIYYMRADILGMFEEEDRGRLRDECRRILARAKEQKSLSLQLQAEIALLSIEGHRYLYDFVSNATMFEGRIQLGLMKAAAQQKLNEKLNADFHTWKQRIDKLIVVTKLKKDRLLFADAVMTGGLLLFGFVFHSSYLSLGLSNKFSIEPQVIEAVIQQIKEAAETFTANNMKHDEVRSKMLIADFYHFLGRKNEAKAIARPVLPIAQAMQYEPMAKHLEQILTESTALEEMTQRLEDFKKIDDEDLLLIRMDDAQLKSFANFNASCYGAPLTLVHADFKVMRSMAWERFNWCQHLQLDSSFINMWQCRCPKTGFISAIVGPQPDSIIAAFKEQYCARCTSRQPKPQPSEAEI